MPPMIQKLQLTLERLSIPTITSEERQKQMDTQALFCGVLQVLINKLETSQDHCRIMITTYADQLMTLFLNVLAYNATSVQEDAMQAIAALVQAMGAEFQKYMGSFYPFLDKGLKNYQEYQVCNVAVGLVGDLCRALGTQLPVEMWDQIVLALLNNVSSATLHRSVKPAILSCFGDIALSLQGQFE
eukprot:3162364-Pyramimonas_sp.AAC.1